MIDNRQYAISTAYAELAFSFFTLAVIVASRPMLITSTHGGMARLSWPGWLVKYPDGIPRKVVRLL